MTSFYLCASLPAANHNVVSELVKWAPNTLLKKMGIRLIHLVCAVRHSNHDILSVLCSDMNALEGDDEEQTPLQLGMYPLYK